MWGWRTVERVVEPAVSFHEAKRILCELGFRLKVSNPSHATFEQQDPVNLWLGTPRDASEAPVELALATSHGGLFLQLRYSTFVLFDTGDLERFADRIAAELQPTEATACNR